MLDRQDTTSGNIGFAFVAGIVFGAGAAMLLAPITGRETRELLERGARQGQARATGAARQGRDLLTRRGNVISAIEWRRRTAVQDPS